MTEKEFLENALGEILNYNSDETWLQEKINKFLEEHHKEYFEVEFIKKEEEDIGINSLGNPYKRTIFK
jgi:hypothetical protein